VTNERALLRNAGEIGLKYEAQRKASGERFNVFKILNLSSSEVRTHSAFLAEILSRDGSHDLGNLFASEFLKLIQIPSKFDLSSYTVEVEKHVGYISDTYDEGGRIDIVLTDKNGNCIIIENKIYAGDQHKQLKRYYNFNKNAHILYLTLFGNPPSKDSLDGISTGQIKNISYHSDILKWLERCKELSKHHGILRETLSQYIYLIRELTHQTLDRHMESELFSLIGQDEASLNSAIKIRNACNSLLQKMHRDFVEAMLKKNSKLYETFSITDYSFKFQQNEDADGLWIGIYPTRNNQGGIIKADKHLLQIAMTIKKLFPESVYNDNWYWLTPLGHNKEYESLDLSERLKIYNDKQLLENYLDNIYLTSERYFTESKKIIHEVLSPKHEII
jgi:hypothetical protein